MNVSSQEKQQWGSQFTDRKNSFDDTSDIYSLINEIQKNKKLQEHLGFKEDYKFVEHPYGQYGVDLGITDENDNVIKTIDVERWSQWDYDFPQFYSYISFLNRKSKFLGNDNFFMIWLNKSQNKFLVVDEETIKSVTPIKKYFKYKGVSDFVRQVPFNKGYIFGNDLTDRETTIFNVL